MVEHMKKTVIAIASLLVICIVLIGSLFIYKTSMVQNVFDEMYYAESQGILKPTRTSFYTVQAIENQSYTSIYQQEGVSTFTVDSAQLLAGETFEVLVYSAEGEVCFLYAVSTSNGSLYFTMGYSIKTKELGVSSVLLEEYTDNSGEYFVDTTEKAIVDEFLGSNALTQEQVATRAQDIVLNVLAPSWIEGNDERTRFYKEDIGRYTTNL